MNAIVSTVEKLREMFKFELPPFHDTSPSDLYRCCLIFLADFCNEQRSHVL